MSFGEYVNDLLVKDGRKVSWLSDKTGIPRTTLYSLFGRSGETSMENMQKILAAFNLSLDDYLETKHDERMNREFLETQYGADPVLYGLSEEELKTINSFADFLRYRRGVPDYSTWMHSAYEKAERRAALEYDLGLSAVEKETDPVKNGILSDDNSEEV